MVMLPVLEATTRADRGCEGVRANLKAAVALLGPSPMLVTAETSAL